MLAALFCAWCPMLGDESVLLPPFFLNLSQVPILCSGFGLVPSA